MNETDSNPADPPADTDAPLTPAELLAISEEIAGEFPVMQGQNGVVLMDIDPHRLHAYWSLPPEVLEAARQNFTAEGQQPHLVLRFRRLSEREKPDRPGAAMSTPLEAFDRELDAASGQVELQIRGDGGRYEAELGLTAEDGGWKLLARSNRVHMPPAGPSPEPGWATVNLAREAALEDEESLSAATAAQSLPMAEDPSLRGGPPDNLEPLFPNPLPSAQEQEEAQQLGVHRVEPGVPRARGSHFEAAGVPDMAAVGKLSSSAEFSGYSIGGGDGELEIHTELHVWGHARPGRQLFLFGLPVPLTPEGDFDVWRELDPSNLLLPVLIDRGPKPDDSE